ncbi:hypothetical protein [Polynucleobacter corsicus]|uniref:hypothetical protein n=1 Tax=Polynucleobacter corsicus TaxID=2081042 RepID=UPI001BFDD5A7|nr:hypothetical protein [Polynucleobacter corsicus]QWE19072.1 hypothetical protein C2747_02225 [Polynucleobacter corsicus]
MESNKSSGLTILLVLLAFGGIGKLISDLGKPTVEQQKFIDDYHYARPRTWLKSLCEEKTACEMYVDVRQQCATAGSISECVKIKMNGSVPNFCGDDGHIVINSLFTGRFDLTEKNIAPSSLQCFALNFVEKEE